jgi:hypothetical protein
VARVEVRADDISNSGTELKQRRDVVNKIERVKLETKLSNPVFLAD